MRRATLSLIALGLLASAAPTVSAQCSLGIDELCEPAESLMLDRAFGEFADIALILLGLVVAALAINLLLWVLFHLRPRRILKVSVNEKVREVDPGGSLRFKIDVENLQGRQPVEVFLEHDGLPAGWTSNLRAAVVLPSGFRYPQEVGPSHSFTLSSAARGANGALVELEARAPTNVTQEETIETEVRVVPVVRGRLKKRAAKRVALTILLVPHLPKVQITKVSHRPDQITVGKPVLTTATVVNKGEREARDVAISFTLNGAEMDKKILPALAVQGAADVEFNWTPQNGENKIRVAVAT